MSENQMTDEEIFQKHQDELSRKAADDRKIPIAHDEPYYRLFNDRRTNG